MKPSQTTNVMMTTTASAKPQPQEPAATAPASPTTTSPAANTASVVDAAGLGVSELPLLFATPSGYIPLWSIARLVPKGDERLEVVLHNGDKLDLAGEVAHLLVTKLTAVSARLQLGSPKLWTTSQLAHRYQVDARTIKAWTKLRKIPVVRISERCLRYNPEACDAVLSVAEHGL